MTAADLKDILVDTESILEKAKLESFAGWEGGIGRWSTTDF